MKKHIFYSAAALGLASAVILGSKAIHQNYRFPANTDAGSGQRVKLSHELDPVAFKENLAFDAEMARLVPIDLVKLQAQEQKELGSAKMEQLNRETLQKINKFVPFHGTIKNGSERTGFLQVDYSVAEAVLKSAKVHPVAGDFFHDFYNANAEEKGTDIGFCFGRAFYVDSILHQMGVDKEAIRKIWIVGSLKIWRFHVATMVNTNRGWIVIDPHTIKKNLTTPEQWFAQFKLLNKFSRDTARVYITDGAKFTAPLSRYSLNQMGTQKVDNHIVRMAPDKDWYANYFIKMVEFNGKEKNRLSLGLTRLIKDPADLNRGMLNSAELEGVTLLDEQNVYRALDEDLRRYMDDEFMDENEDKYRG